MTWEHAPLCRLGELADLVAADSSLHVRFSAGPDRDASSGSRDGESGLELPGLSVNPLGAERWWSRPLEDWLARQLCQYSHLARREGDRFAWVLRGTIAGRGPDCEPLLTEIDPVVILQAELLDEAERRYRDRFDVGHQPG